MDIPLQSRLRFNFIASTGLKATLNQCALRFVVIIIIQEIDTFLTAK